MSPAEFRLMCTMLECAAKAAYRVGRESAEKNVPMSETQFELDMGKRMYIQKEVNKVNNKR